MNFKQEWYTTIETFGVSKIFYFINSFIQQGCIKLVMKQKWQQRLIIVTK